MPDFVRLAIPEIWAWTPRRHEDARGWFSETFAQRTLSAWTGAVDFVQDNQSSSRAAGTVRGLHFQVPPMTQAKLIRVVKGAILDVAVDLRRSSPTFGQHAAVELNAKNGRQVFVPEGFAHGFVTLEPDTEVFYKVSRYFSLPHDRGLLWSDPDLSIDWKTSADAATVSEKDKSHPRLKDLPSYFD